MKAKENTSINDLYSSVVKKLSAHENPNANLSGILEDVCNYFGFGRGLIYQSDYTRKFYLKEYFATYSSYDITETIDLLSLLTNDDIQILLKTPVFFTVNDTEDDALKYKLLELFNTKVLLFVPIKDAQNDFIGFIALVDRRSRLVLDEQSLDAAHTIFTIIANFVKVRIYQQKVENTKNSLLKLLDHIGVDIYVTDFYTFEVLYANTSMAAPYGGVDKMIGNRCWEFLYDDKTAPCDFCPQKHLLNKDGTPTNKVYSWDYQRPFDGSWFRVFSTAFHWVDGRLAHVISCADITENKHNEALVTRMAEYDALTGLPNRHRLSKDGAASLENMKKNNTEGYFLFFDLDKFKEVNDTMGHAVGDELLCTIAKTLMENPYTKDRIYRHGGDEFVVLCENTSRHEVDAITKYILHQFQQPWQLTNSAPTCRASIGIAHFPDDGSSIDELLNKSDRAMYTAKRLGRNNAQFYDSSMHF